MATWWHRDLTDSLALTSDIDAWSEGLDAYQLVERTAWYAYRDALLAAEAEAAKGIDQLIDPEGKA